MNDCNFDRLMLFVAANAGLDLEHAWDLITEAELLLDEWIEALA